MNKLKNRKRQIKYNMLKNLKEKSDLFMWDSTDLRELRDVSSKSAFRDGYLKFSDIDIMINYLIEKIISLEERKKC